MTEQELSDILTRTQCKVAGDPLQKVISYHGFTPREDVEQAAVARWLDLIGVRWMHVPNGGQRNKIVGAKLKGQGVKKGAPDIWVLDAPPLYPCAHGTVIELKRVRGGTVSPEQKDWLEYLTGRGWQAQVCKGANAAIDYLRSLGYGRK